MQDDKEERWCEEFEQTGAIVAHWLLKFLWRDHRYEEELPRLSGQLISHVVTRILNWKGKDCFMKFSSSTETPLFSLQLFWTSSSFVIPDWILWLNLSLRGLHLPSVIQSIYPNLIDCIVFDSTYSSQSLARLTWRKNGRKKGGKEMIKHLQRQKWVSYCSSYKTNENTFPLASHNSKIRKRKKWN